MKIWKQDFSIEGLNAISENTLAAHLKIRFTEFGDNYIIAEMPVNAQTVQPMRILHGGASVVLAETLGSIASYMCIEDLTTYQAVGLDINANHLRSVPENSKVWGRVTPIHIGRSTHVWEIKLTDKDNKAICISRLTVMVRKIR